MIKGIIFDCFGVLYGGSMMALRQFCPPDRVRDLTDFNKRADYGYLSTDEYIVAVADLIQKPVDDVKAIVNAKQIRNNDLIEFVRELKKAGEYQIGLLSNVSAGTIERLFGDELKELFDTTVLSYQYQLIKPAPAIFELTAEKMGLTPGECVMIDDLAENCEGAEIAGMRSIQHITNDSTRLQLAKILQENR
ncbi:MAG: HAD-IA family hydrolase [Candidatus Saccharimonas sp.]